MERIRNAVAPQQRQPACKARVGSRVKLAGYELTDHAAAVIAEREIDVAWIARVLAKPERTEKDREDSALTHALARIAERDDRVLRVVYNASVDPPRIVTSYFDRRERGRT